MAYKFSPSTKGFYIDGVHSNIPSDVVDVTDDEHSAIFQGLTDGKVIGVNPKNGHPMVVDGQPIPLTWDLVRTIRDNMLDDTDWTQVTDNALTEDQRDQWKTYRQKLRDITKTYSDPTAVVWPVKPL